MISLVPGLYLSKKTGAELSLHIFWPGNKYFFLHIDGSLTFSTEFVRNLKRVV